MVNLLPWLINVVNEWSIRIIKSNCARILLIDMKRGHKNDILVIDQRVELFRNFWWNITLSEWDVINIMKKSRHVSQWQMLWTIFLMPHSERMVFFFLDKKSRWLKGTIIPRTIFKFKKSWKVPNRNIFLLMDYWIRLQQGCRRGFPVHCDQNTR